MKKTSRIYIYNCTELIKGTLSFLFILFSASCFSQEKDSAFEFKTVDTVVVTNHDSTDVDTETPEEEAEDSIRKAKYDYYIRTEEWPNDSLDLRQVPDSVVKALKSQDDFWYADKEFKKNHPETPEQDSNWLDWLSRQQWYRTLAWIIIIGGFIAVLFWYLASSNVALFRRKPKEIAGNSDIESSENIFDINYQKEIENAVKAGDYRLATRLLFLRLLKNLSEKNIIQYKQDRTNFDYLVQLSNTGYYKDFFRLARNYEYAWYGEFDVNPDAFAIIKNDFEKFNNRVN